MSRAAQRKSCYDQTMEPLCAQRVSRIRPIHVSKETAMYDMKHLAKMKKFGELAPEGFKGFLAFDEAAFKDGAIPLKYKELMAVAVALTTQCPYCIEIHAKKARKAGATEQELAETTLVAAALRAGGAVTHGTHTLE